MRHTIFQKVLWLSIPLVALAMASTLLYWAVPSMASGSSVGVTHTGATDDMTPIRYVAPVGSDAGNNCTISITPCQTVQYAVDVADDGDEIRIAAGTYTDVSERPPPSWYTGGAASVRQVAYISKTLALRGGYTTTNWVEPDPEANPTVLNPGQSWSRVLFIEGTISVTVENLTISGGYAEGFGDRSSGGGAFVHDAAVVFGGNVFSQNFVPSVYVAPPNPGGRGGGLYLRNSSATLTGNTFVDNSGGYGAGLYQDSGDVELWDNAFRENVGDVGGGACVRETAMLDSNSLISNTASTVGGGLVGWGGTVTLVENTISGNVVKGYDGDTLGGGLELLRTTATLNGNIISGNTVSSTAAGWGGGLDIAESIAILEGNMIYSNTVSCNGNSWGGGVEIYDSTATLSGNAVYSNTVSSDGNGWGGGADLYDGSFSLNGNTFSANTADWGGGLALEADSMITLTNNVVADNWSHDGGGGLFIGSGSHARMLHTTIARNAGGDGSAIHITDTGGGQSSVALTNTILISHAVGITITNANTATMDGILWYNTPITVSQSPTAVVIVQNQYEGHPAFAADGYHLTADSAAIDRGVDASVMSDIDGDTRPRGAAPDLGADEYAPSADFAASPLSGTIPLTVTFTDLSTGTITSWSWDFGDGGTSAIQNPTHTYTVPGSFTVSLTILGVGGSDTETKVGYITAQRQPMILYVDADAPGAETGADWSNAFTRLQAALDVSVPGDEVWVAEGIYTPTAGITRTATFALPNDVALYGGFGGYGISETLRTERDWVAHVTVLSGDLDGDDITDRQGVVTDTTNISGSNAYNVIASVNVDIDGFTVTGGYADGESEPHFYGGGMFNRGGGTVRNVAFKGNFAVTTGGGVFGLLSGVTMTNVTFSGNLAASGGGMSNVCYCPPIGPCIGGCPTLTNVVFSGNSALGGGGGMFNWGREWGPALTNVTFSGNSAATGGAMYNEDSQPTVTNCILWDNIGGQISSDGTSSATVSYSLVQGGYPGTSNIDADPHFADSSSGVYHLLNCSPAIGAGTLDGAPLTDIEGKPRPDPPGSNPDMGAYENPLGSPQPVAAFTASPLSGRAPLDVQFTDQSCGDMDTWNWEFGDGGVSASQNPTHTFTTADAYTVTLTASGPGGSDTETKPAYIVVQGYRIYLPIVLRQSP